LGGAKIDHIPSVSNNGTIARLAAKTLLLELQHAKLPSSNTKIMKTGSTQSRFREFQETTTTNEEKMETSSEETIKQRMIALSLKYNILSPHTAFVSIEKRSNGNNADMVLREVPIQISADDQHLQMPVQALYFAGGGRGLGAGGAIRHRKVLTSNVGGRGAGGAVRHRKVMTSNVGSRGAGGAARNRKVMASNFGGCVVTRSMATSSLSPYANQLSESQRESRRRPHKSAVRKRKNTSLDYNSSDHEDQILPNSWPSNDQDIVRHLINEQKFDGLWDLDSQAV
jgi:hypothetical protein